MQLIEAVVLYQHVDHQLIQVMLQDIKSILIIAISTSHINGKAAFGFSFRSGRNNKICKEYLETGY